jgi:hypothetical protein
LSKALHDFTKNARRHQQNEQVGEERKVENGGVHIDYKVMGMLMVIFNAQKVFGTSTFFT